MKKKKLSPDALSKTLGVERDHGQQDHLRRRHSLRPSREADDRNTGDQSRPGQESRGTPSPGSECSHEPQEEGCINHVPTKRFRPARSDEYRDGVTNIARQWPCLSRL